MKRLCLAILTSFIFISQVHAQPVNTNVNTIPSFALLRAPNGTVALPSISFQSDTDTGLYRIGANNIGIATNGVKRFDINTARVYSPTPLSVLTDKTYTTTGTYIESASGPGLHIKAGSSSNTRSMIVFEDSSGTITTAIAAGGAFYTKTFVSISGAFSPTQNSNGDLTAFTTGASGLSDMLDIVGDTAYNIVSKASTVPSQNYTGLDHSGNFTFNVSELGNVQWGVGSTFGSLDTSLSRTGAAALAIGNGTQGDFSGTLKLTTLNTVTSYQLNGVLFASATAPTIASGGCTSPAVTHNNGTVAFLITIGTSCSGVSTVTLTMPAAAHFWACSAINNTSAAQQAANAVLSRATSTTAVILTNYAVSTGTASDFTASDTVLVRCVAE